MTTEKKPLFIEITGCSDPLLWYKDKIGKEFKVHEDINDMEMFVWNDGEIGWVCKTDCRIVEGREDSPKPIAIRPDKETTLPLDGKARRRERRKLKGKK